MDLTVEQMELIKKHICSINNFFNENKDSSLSEWIRINLENKDLKRQIYITPNNNYLIVNGNLCYTLDKDTVAEEDEDYWVGNLTSEAISIINQWSNIKKEFLKEINRQKTFIDSLYNFEV